MQQTRQDERRFAVFVSLLFLAVLSGCLDSVINNTLTGPSDFRSGGFDPSPSPGFSCDNLTSLNLDVEWGLNGAGELDFGKTAQLTAAPFAAGIPLPAGTCAADGLQVFANPQAVCQLSGAPTLDSILILAVGRGVCVVNVLFKGIVSNPITFIVVGGPQ